MKLPRLMMPLALVSVGGVMMALYRGSSRGGIYAVAEASPMSVYEPLGGLGFRWLVKPSMGR